MDTGEIVLKLFVSLIFTAPILYFIVSSGRMLFMPKDKFEKFLLEKSRVTMSMFKWYQPSIVLMRILYAFLLALGIVCLFGGALGMYVLWRQ